MTIQLVPLSDRELSSQEWINRTNRAIAELQLAGIQARLRPQGVRGIRTSSGDDDISIRIQGDDLEQLNRLARETLQRLTGVPGLQNLAFSAEEETQELDFRVDRERAAALGIDVVDINSALLMALEGRVVNDYVEQGRSYDIRIRFSADLTRDIQDIESVMLFVNGRNADPVYLSDLVSVSVVQAPGNIRRDSQMRVVDVSASLMNGYSLANVMQEIDQRLADMQMPEGYSRFDGGAGQALQEGQALTGILLGLALFLVFVVMAVQYESLRNPVIIILSVPFSAIGVAGGLVLLDMPLSMPVWLGMIMLAGIVVNNAIVLVEYIELQRDRGMLRDEAIIAAAKLRLRPILMTTLTTVAGMLPLAIGIGEGSEMLRPLAVAIVFGLSFSTLVGLLLVPVIYSLLHPMQRKEQSALKIEDVSHAR
ncbi:efflux RND transporter permease subunit [Nitrincola nitratireducens]|uniref:Multidrug transporter MdtC n=1 Tax=Nitrincola nitratireducens TaxID=1229521 RepID=W9VPN8_9GAMM|nr:efflux RND transporter permease subunit [Nitrincola nitratireducens]EXJ12405.1 Multidrug transporter MdtC [Nitrincola nitratireducens]